jgi:uncharacterized membrane protein YczE
MKVFKIKSVPVVSWSSNNPLCFRPRLLTTIWLIIGLFLFGSGETLMIAAGAGVSPWTVLAQGISAALGVSVGAATFYIGIGILLLWVPLKRTPGIGTILNIIIIAAVIEFLLAYLPIPKTHLRIGLYTIVGVLLVGLGSGFYLIANLGTGPRDGLMTGLQNLTNIPIAWVRMAIEITVTFIGWTLGGVVGVGTVIFAIGIGPAVSLGLYIVATLSKECRQAS